MIATVDVPSCLSVSPVAVNVGQLMDTSLDRVSDVPVGSFVSAAERFVVLADLKVDFRD